MKFDAYELNVFFMNKSKKERFKNYNEKSKIIWLSENGQHVTNI